MGREFVVYIDQRSLKDLLTQRVTTANQQNWMAKLLGFKFEVTYKPGLENKAADALSSLPLEGELASITSYPAWSQGRELLGEVEKNADL